MDESLSEKINEMNIDKEIKMKNKIKKDVSVDSFIDEVIKPKLSEYFKKIEEMGGEVENLEDFNYSISYKGTNFSLFRNINFNNKNYDFNLSYTYDDAGVINGKNFTMNSYKDTFTDFILDFHKYLLSHS